MIKQTIKYKNHDDVEVTEDFYFHLSKGDVNMLDIQYMQYGGIIKYMEGVHNRANLHELISLITMLIGKAYGRRTEDGRFYKTEIETAIFLSSDAYFNLIESFLGTEANPASEEKIEQFFKGLFPKMD